jgi:glycosyltransferase 2 family protein
VSYKQILSTLVKATFLGLLIYFCLQFLIPHWQSLQLSDRLGALSKFWILAATVFTLGYYGLGLLIWTIVLRNLGSQPDVYITTRAYVLSLLAKYVPGSVAAHGVRTRLAMRAGVPILALMKSFLFEAVFALGTAAAIAIPGSIYFVPALIDHRSSLVVALAVFILVTIVAATQLELASIHKSRLTSLASGMGYVNVGFLYLLVWLVSAAAHWCLANALNDYSISHFPLLLVAVSASWAIGFVSFFAPAGLGVREAVLYFFLNSWMDQADVILFVTLSRVLMFGVEVFLSAGFLLYSKVARQAETAMTC